MYSQSAAHDHDTMCIRNSTVSFLERQISHLVAGNGNYGPASDHLAQPLEMLLHIQDLFPTSRLGHSGTCTATNKVYSVHALQLPLNLFKRLLSGNRFHPSPPK